MQNNGHDDQPLHSPNAESKKLSIGKLCLCYFVAGVFTLIIISSVSSTIATGSNYILQGIKLDKTIYFGEVVCFFGVLWMGFTTMRYFADTWRSQSDDLKLGFTDWFNYFYDPTFVKGPIFLKMTNRKLNTENTYFRDLNNELQEQNNNLTKYLTIFVRHHENANRLLSSASYLLKHDRERAIGEMLKNILTECVTVLNLDVSDKSIALYQVVEDKLVMREYSRISAQSSRTRTFRKGEGFAGLVWEKNQEMIREVVDTENDPVFAGANKPKHDFRSIIGLPIRVGDKVLGVLCIQSEQEKGFYEDDLRAVRFYANCCSFVFLCDTLVHKGGDS